MSDYKKYVLQVREASEFARRYGIDSYWTAVSVDLSDTFRLTAVLEGEERGLEVFDFDQASLEKVYGTDTQQFYEIKHKQSMRIMSKKFQGRAIGILPYSSYEGELKRGNLVATLDKWGQNSMLTFDLKVKEIPRPNVCPYQWLEIFKVKRDMDYVPVVFFKCNGHIQVLFFITIIFKEKC